MLRHFYEDESGQTIGTIILMIAIAIIAIAVIVTVGNLVDPFRDYFETTFGTFRTWLESTFGISGAGG